MGFASRKAEWRGEKRKARPQLIEPPLAPKSVHWTSPKAHLRSEVGGCDARRRRVSGACASVAAADQEDDAGRAKGVEPGQRDARGASRGPVPLSPSAVYSRLPIRPHNQRANNGGPKRGIPERTRLHGPHDRPPLPGQPPIDDRMMLAPAMLPPLLLLALAGRAQQQQQHFPRTRFQPVHRYPPLPNGIKLSPELINQALQLPPNGHPQGPAQQQQQQSFRPQRMVQLTIPQGVLRGRVLRTPSGRGLVAFLGVPYAAAPLGPLRFKPPVIHPGWSSVLDATAFRSACPQFDYRGRIVGNEDCLFLNIYTPGYRNGQTPSYPVMVFVHGGNFETGASSQYGPQKLVDKDVVVVTINYRLGILGFLSTGDSVCPGNLGLLDQNLALKWVRDNVGHFGGDPSQVTLFGQGSGAVSVFLHILSPLSQGEWQVQMSVIVVGRSTLQIFSYYGIEAVALRSTLFPITASMLFFRKCLRKYGHPKSPVFSDAIQTNDSKISPGLFVRAIAESGSPLSDWAVEPEPAQFKRIVAQGAGCPTDGPSFALIDCLMQTPSSELLRIQQESKVRSTACRSRLELSAKLLSRLTWPVNEQRLETGLRIADIHIRSHC
ncbi:hypothetical protein HPB49_021433 [Dermacentor silvarum]|uniref:Uncharacterized protein n=1 Tax=Dermacentor silvarum TaxID=543639 RepID=A0ACB8E3K3_DERSI|nr:hypothetical protein HPB49_021433 [Dermacentor silvarum]